MAVYVVDTDGRRYTRECLTAKNEWRRRCLAEGIPFRVTQGGFNFTVKASAETHHGDSLDVSVVGLTEKQVSRMIQIGREVGFACWFRTTTVAKWGTRAQGFKSYHVHAVPNFWGSPSAQAHDQAVAYRNGRDGLSRNLADLGPGHVSTYRTRTWAQYLAIQQAQQPKEFFDMFKDKKELEDFLRPIIRSEVDNFLSSNKVFAPMEGQSIVGSSWRNNMLHQTLKLESLQQTVAAMAKQPGVPVDIDTTAERLLDKLSARLAD